MQEIGHFSQNAEDTAILQACAGLPSALQRFLDIGAYHPKYLSNTRALYEAGWSGVMIEPLSARLTVPSADMPDRPELVGMASLVEEYGTDPRIDLIQCAIACEPGLRHMHIDGGGGTTSSLDSKRVRGEIIGSPWVPCLTLQQILTQFGANFGFVSIDAEGKSIELALNLLSITNAIHCICVEYDADNLGLLSQMTRNGYQLIASFQENGVFSK